MNEDISWLRLTELDRISSAELAERIARADEQESTNTPRRYPGYPTWPLPRRRTQLRRPWP